MKNATFYLKSGRSFTVKVKDIHMTDTVLGRGITWTGILGEKKLLHVKFDEIAAIVCEEVVEDDDEVPF